MKKPILAVTTFFFMTCTAVAQDMNTQRESWEEQILSYIERHTAEYDDMALEIGSYAELGFQEWKSSARLSEHLEQNGFDVERGVADMRTAFVASYGTEGPVIGILAEFDALPGFSQAPQPEKLPLEGMSTGHACGHHLLGTASIEAAVALKNWLDRADIPATVRVYGTPAEEGGGGKVYMTREGLFDDVDAMMNWHPADQNAVTSLSTMANISGKFRFHGESAHAAAAPERGRSALDAVEAMNDMVNMMREHIPSGVRIHYVITSGGSAPNVVPDFAEVYYYVRHDKPDVLRDVWGRVNRAAEGAALGTDTRSEVEIVSAVYPLLPNDALAQLTDKHLKSVGGVTYTPEEAKFASQMSTTFGQNAKPLDVSRQVRPLFMNKVVILPASTDVGDVSWVTPTNSFVTATWVPGTAPHSWQAVAAGNTSIGLKGMHVASKVMGLTAAEMIMSPDTLTAVKSEHRMRRGEKFEYESFVGDAPPQLDYATQ
ncbi:hypothetical protein L53_04250 [Hyphomonas sp. L-53-1-40]|uniref:amidohydrolase n=1 Tax=Hyphomonas sp. L-53-1-40 TaxID=1207058 RepID=UPI000458B1DB|nr:amidohydrolase [Hyphomonas sp. L-53-1-40]KCZ63711.1 hypothetical protein L53_04250 [Hyphomonas sp. L-53-1-40]